MLRPKFGDHLVGRWLATKLSDPHYRILLDDVGSFVWKACDGETPLAIIAGGLRAKFGGRVEPVEERLGEYVRTMLRSRLIEV